MILVKADARHIPLRDETVQCVVTSPPYWGLRDYGLSDKGIGLEGTPEEYVGNMVQVFRDVWRVLRGDGVVWLNLGDSYAAGGNNSGSTIESLSDKQRSNAGCRFERRTAPVGLKPKDLVGIPWRVALALQADRWYLRSDCIWSKPNPMPESVRDRPTKAHEYVFLLSKGERYYYDQAAVMEVAIEGTDLGLLRGKNAGGPGADKISWHAKSIKDRQDMGIDSRTGNPSGRRNLRTVWTIPTQPFSGAHFATFPEALAERCIKAGSRKGDVVLDPFGGSGTVARVAVRLGRRAVHMDLGYHELAKATRCTQIQREAFV